MMGMAKENPGDEGGVVRDRAEPKLKTKKNGSVIPPKRKLVKKKVFDSILHFITSLFPSKHRRPASSKELKAEGWRIDDGSRWLLPAAPPNPIEWEFKNMSLNPSYVITISLVLYEHIFMFYWYQVASYYFAFLCMIFSCLILNDQLRVHFTKILEVSFFKKKH